jgi:hypothetical protein
MDDFPTAKKKKKKKKKAIANNQSTGWYLIHFQIPDTAGVAWNKMSQQSLSPILTNFRFARSLLLGLALLRGGLLLLGFLTEGVKVIIVLLQGQ